MIWQLDVAPYFVIGNGLLGDPYNMQSVFNIAGKNRRGLPPLMVKWFILTKAWAWYLRFLMMKFCGSCPGSGQSAIRGIPPPAPVGW